MSSGEMPLEARALAGAGQDVEAAVGLEGRQAADRRNHTEPDQEGREGPRSGVGDERPVLPGPREGPRLERHLTRAQRDPPAALHELGHRAAPGRSPKHGTPSREPLFPL